MPLFMKQWQEEIWLSVQPVYEELLAKKPLEQKAGATGIHYGKL